MLRLMDIGPTGTVAALVQTVAYVAFTPVGALLSTIGSMAVTGYLNPLLTDLALLLGAAVTLVLWPFLSGVVA